MKLEVYVPSSREIKVTAARNAVISRFKISPDEIQIHSMKLPEDGLRATEPVAIFGNRGILKAAQVRISQMEKQIEDDSDTLNLPELIIAQESGLKIHFPWLWLKNGITSEATVTLAKNRKTGKLASGVSEGVKVKLTDVKAILNPDLSVWHKVIESSLKRQGRNEDVDDIDWYSQYDKSNPSRAECIEEATRQAINSL